MSASNELGVLPTADYGLLNNCYIVFTSCPSPLQLKGIQPRSAGAVVFQQLIVRGVRPLVCRKALKVVEISNSLLRQDGFGLRRRSRCAAVLGPATACRVALFYVQECEIVQGRIAH